MPTVPSFGSGIGRQQRLYGYLPSNLRTRRAVVPRSSGSSIVSAPEGAVLVLGEALFGEPRNHLIVSFQSGSGFCHSGSDLQLVHALLSAVSNQLIVQIAWLIRRECLGKK